MFVTNFSQRSLKIVLVLYRITIGSFYICDFILCLCSNCRSYTYVHKREIAEWLWIL